MATKQQFFPASIVDETAYFMEGAINTTLTYGWTLTLKGEVDSDIVRQALDNNRELLEQVRAQRIFLQENDAARIAPALTWILKFMPIKLKEVLFKHHSHALYPSLCLSNMGVCDYNRSHRDEGGFHYMGPARIIGSNAVTAAIPWPQFFIHTYNSKMEVSLSAFRSHFSFEAAHMLLDAYIQELTGRYN